MSANSEPLSLSSSLGAGVSPNSPRPDPNQPHADLGPGPGGECPNPPPSRLGGSRGLDPLVRPKAPSPEGAVSGQALFESVPLPQPPPTGPRCGRPALGRKGGRARAPQIPEPLTGHAADLADAWGVRREASWAPAPTVLPTLVVPAGAWPEPAHEPVASWGCTRQSPPPPPGGGGGARYEEKVAAWLPGLGVGASQAGEGDGERPRFPRYQLPASPGSGAHLRVGAKNPGQG
eukprot:5755785-Amphidinium_carterae.2